MGGVRVSEAGEVLAGLALAFLAVDGLGWDGLAAAADWALRLLGWYLYPG